MAIFEPIEDLTDGPRRRLSLRSPVDMTEIGVLDCLSNEDVDAAAQKARLAQPTWGALSVAQRVRHMRRLRDTILAHQQRIIATVIKETGKPLQDALTFEIFAVCDFITYWCKQAPKSLVDHEVELAGALKRMKKVRIAYKPLGVVGIITPWNGPFVLVANPAVQAMLAGNAVLIKGSEVTPYSAKIFEEMCALAGVPDGVCQVLLGDAQTGAALTQSKVDKIAFTGSVATGKRVAMACAEKLIPYTLELGGKDAMIVCADADIEQASHGALWGGCVNTGHFCCGVERVYVEAVVYDEFVEKLIEKAKAVRQGPQHGAEEDLGAVFWDRQMQIIESHVDNARALGATIHVGGERLKDTEGLYYPPTIITGVEEDWDIMRHETFGPVLPVVKVVDIDEAIKKANDSMFGLHGSVWTKNVKKGISIARRIDTGSMAVNDIGMMYGIAPAPFGGVKDSGIGVVNGQHGLRSYTHAQPVVTGRYGGFDSGYPYGQKKYDQIQRFMGFMWKNPLGKLFFG